MTLKRAFSLVELVIVIVILGILINIAVVQQSSYLTRAKEINLQGVKQSYQSTLQIYQFKFLSLAKESQDFSVQRETESGLKNFTLKFQASPDWSIAQLRDLDLQECENYLEFFGNQEQSSISNPVIWNISYDSANDKCLYSSAQTSESFFYDNSTGLVQ